MLHLTLHHRGFNGSRTYRTDHVNGKFGQIKKETKEPWGTLLWWRAEIRDVETGNLIRAAGIWNTRKDALEEIEHILKEGEKHFSGDPENPKKKFYVYPSKDSRFQWRIYQPNNPFPLACRDKATADRIASILNTAMEHPDKPGPECSASIQVGD